MKLLPLEDQLANIFMDQEILSKFGELLCQPDVKLNAVCRFANRVVDEKDTDHILVTACNIWRPRTIGADGDTAAIRLVWRACRRLSTDDPSDEIIEETKPMGKKLNGNLCDFWANFLQQFF